MISIVNWLVLSSFLACTVGVLSADITDKHGFGSFLGGSEFKVDIVVKVIKAGSSHVKLLHKLTEYYSSEQNRARINFHPSGEDFNEEEINYYYANNILLRQSQIHFTTTCQLLPMSSLDEDVLGVFGDGYFLSELRRAGQDTIPRHVIGLSRLAFIVSANRNKMKRIARSVISKRPVVGYSLDFNFEPTDSESKSQIFIYYDMNTTMEEKFPLRIVATISTRDWIIVDYSGLRPVTYNGLADIQPNVLSMFLFPRAKGCSNQLPATNLFENREMPRLVSFTSTTYDHAGNAPSSKYFVAWDGFLKISRRELLSDKSSVTINDYRRQLKFNVDRSQSNNKEESNYYSRCIITPLGGESNPLEPLIPLADLKELGRATVRGVDVVVFEHTDNQLPVVFFPPVSYTDSSKQVRNTYNSDPNCLNFTQNFTINYYFAIPTTSRDDIETELHSNGPLLGPLMRIEVFEGVLLSYRQEIENFVWQLAESPDGDRADELFKLAGDCISYNTNEQATLDLNLQVGGPSKRDHEQVHQRMLNNHIERKVGVLRALSDENNSFLSGIVVHDLVSIVQADSVTGNVRIDAKVQLSELNKAMKSVRAVGVGVGRLQDDYIGYLSDFETCFWDAARKFAHRNLVFSHCQELCVIDDRITQEQESDGNYHILTMDKFEFTGQVKGSCELLRFQWQDRKEEDWNRFQDWKVLESRLKANVLRVPLIFENRVDWLELLVKQASIYNGSLSSYRKNENTSIVNKQSGLKLDKNQEMRLQTAGILVLLALSLASGLTLGFGMAFYFRKRPVIKHDFILTSLRIKKNDS